MKQIILGLALLMTGAENYMTASSQLGFFELICSDLGRARHFYSELFDWQFRDTSSADFVMIDGAGIPGGMIRDPSPIGGRPNAKIFFTVERLKSKLAQAERLGAKTIIPPMRVSPSSVIAEFSDLDQNIVGMICQLHCSE